MIGTRGCTHHYQQRSSTCTPTNLSLLLFIPLQIPTGPLQPGDRVPLPSVLVEGTVLFPGQTLPLMVFGEERATVERALSCADSRRNLLFIMTLSRQVGGGACCLCI